MATVLGASALVIGTRRGNRRIAGARRQALLRRAVRRVVQAQAAGAPAGYGIAAHDPSSLFPLAPSLPWVVGARFADRIGKGIRGAPRDALIADIAPPELRGRSFGLRQDSHRGCGDRTDARRSRGWRTSRAISRRCSGSRSLPRSCAWCSSCSASRSPRDRIQRGTKPARGASSMPRDAFREASG